MAYTERQLRSYTSAIHGGAWCTYTLIMVVAMALHTASAQQAYNNATGYACTGKYQACQAYTLYRTQSGNETFASVATLVNSTASTVAKTSGRRLTSRALPPQTPLYIPLSCACLSDTYQAQATHRIVPNDTYTVIANNSYEGLTSVVAIQAANPTLNVTNLQIGDAVKIPLRCACPSAPQLKNGSRFLLTYVIFPDETLTDIGQYFGVSTSELQSANGLTDSKIQGFSTLLIPLATLPALSSIAFVAPQTPPSVAPTPSGGAAPGAAPSTLAAAASKDPSNTPLYIGIAVGAFGVVLAAIFAALLARITHRQRNGGDLHAESEKSLRKYAATGTSAGGFQSEPLARMSDVVGTDKPTTFTYEELRDATNDFDDHSRIQGSVYLGKLHGMLVAIKQMQGDMTQELKILTRVHHGNVVRLVGICVSSSEHLFLVFEYAENGSLSDCLHNQIANPSTNFSRSMGLLPWTTRVQIALDVASGLEYIHNYTNPSLVHKDVKSSNILLYDNFRAKVANFGMAKQAPDVYVEAGPMLTNHIVGTQGYMAPEYLEHGLVTTKADVFSFGVVLLELLSGQEAIVHAAAATAATERPLYRTILAVLEGENQMQKLRAWMDPRLQTAYPVDTAFSVADLAKSCVDTDPARRPSMKDITYALSMTMSASSEWESSRVSTSSMSDETTIAAR